MSNVELFRKILEEDYIHVMDDFLPDVSSLLNYKIDKTLGRQQKANYPGHILMMEREMTNFVHEHIRKNFQIDFPEITYGRFRETVKADNGTQNSLIHFDDHVISLLIYAQLPKANPDSQGTWFYERKDNAERRCKPSKSFKEHMIQNMIVSDHHSDRWNTWKIMTPKVNRALLFDGHLFHSGPPVLEGEGHGDTRIVMEFRIDRNKIIDLI